MDILKSVLPVGNYFIRNDGTMWVDEECTKQLQPVRKMLRNADTRPLGIEYCEYDYAFLFPRPYSMQQAMKRFLFNPLPFHKKKNYAFDRIDHINYRNKTNNSVENLRYSNAHLNSLNRLLTKDMNFDETNKTWSASFRTTCRGLNEYTTNPYKTFAECWEAYKKLRKEVHDSWYVFYLTSN